MRTEAQQRGSNAHLHICACPCAGISREPSACNASQARARVFRGMRDKSLVFPNEKYANMNLRLKFLYRIIKYTSGRSSESSQV